MNKPNLIGVASHVNAVRVAKCAFAVLDGTQDFRPEEQVVGSALTFLLWCRRYGVDPREIMLISDKIYNEGITEQNDHVQALRRYMKVDVSDAHAITF